MHSFLPHSQSTRKFEEQTKVTSCGKKSLVYFGSKSLSPSQYIISICYPLSFIHKVEHSCHLFSFFTCGGAHRPLAFNTQVPVSNTFWPSSICNDLLSITWSAQDWVKKQPPLSTKLHRSFIPTLLRSWTLDSDDWNEHIAIWLLWLLIPILTPEFSLVLYWKVLCIEHLEWPLCWKKM